MRVSYRRLWHRLLDSGMNKSELQKRAGITWAALAKLTKNENVNTDVLIKICSVLDCQIGDIVEATHEVKDVAKNEK